MTHGRAEIHELLLANDLRPSRALGQNFVADGNTVRKIVRLAGIVPGQRVVEIGAGLGSLTLALVSPGALGGLQEYTSTWLWSAVPTAMQNEADGHDTPERRALAPDGGLGVVWTIHVLPSKASASDAAVPVMGSY